MWLSGDGEKRSMTGGSRGWHGLLILWLTLLWGLEGCSPDRKAPNILFITMDTTRADHLSAFGYPRPTSPFLEQLASRGVRFDAVYAPINLTTAAHATLFTGQNPPEHGVRANVGEGFRLPEEAWTLAEVLQEVGYRTAAFTAAYTAGGDTGLAQGFDVFREPRYEGRAERPGDEVLQEAVAWLAAQEASLKPLFLWVHFFDPHGPYRPPEVSKQAVVADERGWKTPAKGSPTDDVWRYDGEIHFMDRLMAQLLEAVAARGPWLVSVVADHGETLTERACGFHHGHNLFEEQVRVPWILAGVGVPKGKVVSERLPTIDIASTVLGAVGVPPPASFRGRNLIPVIRAGAAPAPQVLFFENGFCDPARCSDCAPAGLLGKLTGVREGSKKLVRTPIASGVRLELYDLATDPGETRDVSAQHPELVGRLQARLEAHFKVAPRRNVPLSGSPEGKERLRALGYAQ